MDRPKSSRGRRPLSGPDPQFAKLIERFRPYLLSVAARELDTDLRPKGAASDLVQETCMAAYRDRGQFQGKTPDELRAWLRAIMRFQLAQLRRRFRAAAARDVGREVSADRLPEGCEPAAQTTAASELTRRREELGRLAEAVRWLPEPQRQIVTRRIEGGETFAQIGKRLGMTTDAVRIAWKRALHRLRGWMELSERLARRLGNQ